MAVNLKGRSFLTLLDFSPLEIRYMLDLGHDLKFKKRTGIYNYILKGKNIVLLFEKGSTRTRCAFEVAALEEGAHVTFLDQNSSHFGHKESIEDTAEVLGRFYDGIEYRGYAQKVVEDIAKYSGVPVYNGLTDTDHPTQILADVMTIEEHVFKPLYDVQVAFVGDTRNNMAFQFLRPQPNRIAWTRICFTSVQKGAFSKIRGRRHRQMCIRSRARLKQARTHRNILKSNMTPAILLPLMANRCHPPICWRI